MIRLGLVMATALLTIGPVAASRTQGARSVGTGPVIASQKHPTARATVKRRNGPRKVRKSGPGARWPVHPHLWRRPVGRELRPNESRPDEILWQGIPEIWPARTQRV
jgi:hypothetical protein